MNRSEKKRTREQYHKMHHMNSKDDLNEKEQLLYSEKETKINSIESNTLSSSKNLFLIPKSIQAPIDRQVDQANNQKLLNPFIIPPFDNNNLLPSAFNIYSNTLLTIKESPPSDFFFQNKANGPFDELKPKVELFEQCLPVYTMITKGKYHCKIAEYNFNERKYISKGKGCLSIEATKNDKEYYLVFRNHAMNILFQGRLVPNITTFSSPEKKYSLVITVNKLLMKDDNNIISVKAIKSKLLSEEDRTALENELNSILQQLPKEVNSTHANTISILTDIDQCNEKPKGRIITTQEHNHIEKEGKIALSPNNKKPKLIIRCVKIDKAHSS